jgi:hypothetical protein
LARALVAAERHLPVGMDSVGIVLPAQRERRALTMPRWWIARRADACDAIGVREQ